VSFKENLIKARGQIVFIVALVVSVVAIIWLEAFDPVPPRNGPPELRPMPESVLAAAGAALKSAEADYAADPRSETALAAMLTALATAVQVGLLTEAEGSNRVEQIVIEMEAKNARDGPMLTAALSLAAATFPRLQQRIAALLP
jgi:hypothetical protein